MSAVQNQEYLWSRLSEAIAAHFGLHFPAGHRDQLRRCVSAIRQSFNLEDDAACIDWLLAEPLAGAREQALAEQLTIGETYFFRDIAAFNALNETILPALIERRRGRSEQLKLLSIGCCTGEEAYSLAIALRAHWPELQRWGVEIVGADLNSRFLAAAKDGIYKEWSFRNAPRGLKESYFTALGDGRYAIDPTLRSMVSFTLLNLAGDAFPCAASNLHDADVIFCRNVLMYFTPEQLGRAVAKLHDTLRPGGWLIVSPSESSSAWFKQFSVVNDCGAILFRRAEREWRARSPAESDAPHTPRTAPRPRHDAAVSRPRARVQDEAAERPSARTLVKTEAQIRRESLERAVSHFDRADYVSAATLAQSLCEHSPDRAGLRLLVRSLANLGKLAEAESWCDRWIALDKLEPAARYLRATVLLEMDRRIEAREALQQALYLDPQFVVAHFALGNLARSEGKSALAARHFDNALESLGAYGPEALVPESDGLSAGKLAGLITTLV